MPRFVLCRVAAGLALLWLSVPSVARAAESHGSRPARSDFSVGVTGAWPAIYWLSEDGRLDLGGGIGGAVHLGWQARSWLGVEFVGDFASGVYWGDDIGSAIGTVGPRFQSPRGPVRPYASLGVGGGAAELDNGSGDGWVGFAAFRAAAGLDFHVTDSVSILVEGAGILGLWPSDTTYIQLAPRVGAAYRF